MIEASRIQALLDERKPHHSLPQPFYRDADLFDHDMEAIFHRSWLLVGFEAELAEPGSYLALTIGRSPILLVRQKDGTVAGFFNSCRHRGAQICADGHGRAARLVCPYHQWTYGTDGRLLSAARMAADFDKDRHGLNPIGVECVGGCVYVCLSPAHAPDFAPFRAALEPMLAPHRLAEARLATSIAIVDKANWKLVMENGRECHHCAACHPELKIAFPVSAADSTEKDEVELFARYAERMAAAGLEVGPRSGDWWHVARFPLNPGAKSFSLDGTPLVAKPMVEACGGDIGTLRWATEPNSFCHAAGDNAFMFSAIPTGPMETTVIAKWLVHKDAVEGVDYDLDRLTHVWMETNLQDRELAENNQRGVNGAGYVPGPYSPEAEEYVDRFVSWYCDRLREQLAVDGVGRSRPTPSKLGRVG
ncbi:Rieske (2Fe-2S) domain protein [Rhizorhabdus wittichii RW1]|jgi:Rieske 2Fe-2S family protein|uniref:Rieske (2Fe-2S) domain protein n=1 Tax=Rhizorhabdus wittichii (strain DSM 6014 / CCUG 31198 / JCM 15750 / NBRC 105917 / EY 4224 / RW1) TaxID=392499 RepID=A0A9J9H9P4_RHIWR|nr:aromatic ring-hydroxylating dioxygenase subunit alpha [Rhizorhabdus wittichii]ABQ67299.1 Rieske (2Fe-2S) domain protein [Rhizorhabdus wittichii RW1]